MPNPQQGRFTSIDCTKKSGWITDVQYPKRFVVLSERLGYGGSRRGMQNRNGGVVRSGGFVDDGSECYARLKNTFGWSLSPLHLVYLPAVRGGGGVVRRPSVFGVGSWVSRQMQNAYEGKSKMGRKR